MHRSLGLVIAVAACVMALVSPIYSALASDPLELTLFYSPLCSSCEEFSARILPAIQAAYGSALSVRKVDVSTADGLAELEQAEAAAGSFNNPLPVLLLDGSLLANENLDALASALSSELEARLGPPAEPAASSTPAQPAATPASTTPEPICSTNCTTAPPLHIAYVSKAYCDVCDRTRLLIDVLKQEYPQIIVHEFDQSADAELLEAIGQHLGIPSDQRLVAPSIYVGQRALIGEEQVTSAALRQVLQEYQATGAPEFWTELDTSTATSSILSRFRGLSLAAVAVAGLIDGVNPCAFATILFFVSYLAVSRRQRREMLLVGGSFAAGVFVAYLAVGLGAMELLSVVQAIRGFGYVLYGLMGVTCLVLGALSLRDYVLARQGRLADMSLNLPTRLRDRIHERIRAGRRAYCGAAFISGIAVSLMELACTGQVYLPTISFVLTMDANEMRASALAYLVIYNVAFILPLLVVLGLATYGVSARRLQEVFVRHAAKSKLAMAILFVTLGALLIVQVVAL